VAESLKLWKIILARTGLVLLMISLALYVASFIPRGPLPFTSSSSSPSDPKQRLWPGQFDLYATPSLQAINPQVGMKIIFTSNKTLNMEVYSLNYSIVAPALKFSENGRGTNGQNQNATALAEFEAAYANDLILRQNISSGTTTFYYFPPKIENATVIVSNPTPHVARWSFNSEDIEAVAAPESLSLALIIATSLGVVLILPWLVFTLKEKRETKLPT
jgi:hypothetical protein